MNRATHEDSASSTHSVSVAVLAAGASSRMGRHKLLLPLAGKPVVTWPVLAACASQAREVLVVLGRDAIAVQTALPPGRYHTLINPEYARGQGTSLALATSSLAPGATGLIVLLADQPFMDTASIDQILIAAGQWPDRIIVGSINGHAGHPVYLPQRLFAELLALTGDIGAREIIARERGAVRKEPLANDLAHLDVDTDKDYQRAREMAFRLGTSQG